MHTLCVHAQAHISAKLSQIRDIKVSMELGEYAGPISALHLIQAYMLACMHTICLHAQAHIFAKLCHFREIKVTI